MPPKPLFADIHCHPGFKPYGHSFDTDHPDPTPEITDKISLWHRLEPSRLDLRLSKELNAALYSQSDLQTAAAGGLQIIGISIGALEKEFVTIKRNFAEGINDAIGFLSRGNLSLEDFFCNLVTRFGKKRLDRVQAAKTYFDDLLQELRFIRAQEGLVFRLEDETFYTFRIVENGAMLAEILARNAEADAGRTEARPVILCVVLSLEGLHSLDAANGVSEATVMEHVAALKSAEFPLFFVTFCHHFWNGLCGHAQSLTGLMANVFDQDAHMTEGFHPLGLKVLMELLSRKSGRRVLIDLKHMSYKARNQYYDLLNGNMPEDLDVSPELKNELQGFFRFNLNAAPGTEHARPAVIVSHTAVNGYSDQSHNAKTYKGNFPAAGATGVESPFENPAVFQDPAINMFDSDLINLARFDCLIGLQLDMRRISGAKGVEMAETQGDLQHAYLVWNQVVHMVEVWDRQSTPGAWDRLCIGSDFDGIISPIKGLERVSDYPELRKGLIHYCTLYLMPAAEFAEKHPEMAKRGSIANRFQTDPANPSGRRLNGNGPNAPERLGLAPEDIVDKICVENAFAFMKRNFV